MRTHCTLLAALGCAWLPACGDPPEGVEAAVETAGAPPAPSAPAHWRWRCDDDVTFDTAVHGNRIVLQLAGGDVTLPQVEAASGTKYADGPTSFWSKGGNATLVFQGDKLACHGRRDPWDEALARGIVLRAVGQEPGWTLEIGSDTMHLLYDYAEQEATAPAPEPQRDGGVTTWAATAGAQSLRAVAEETRCADAMSGETFPLTVTVEIDGRRLEGCGRRLERD
jgi:membrane-bound inhibitor of C-type lysozyme